MAEYVAIPVMNLFPLPSNASFEVGAAIEPLGVAMRAFEQSGFKPGDKILIIGPGPIGLGMLMIAKISGSSKIFITGVNVDQERLKKAKELGADTVFNIQKEDPLNRIMDETQGRGVDIAFVGVGSKEVLVQATKMVRKGGTVIVFGIFQEKADFDPSLMVVKELTFKGSWRRNPETWYRCLDLVGSGKINLNEIISHILPLQEIEKAFQLLKKGEAIKVVMTP
jgi:L-iditol 2-dehydrogenase